MYIHELLENMKNIQSYLLKFIKYENQDEENLENLVKNIEDLKLKSNKHEMKLFLYMINQISNSHYRYPRFFSKIEQILIIIQKEIQQYYTNWELFKIFKENKMILLFFIQEKMIKFDKMILKEILTEEFYNGFFVEYFSPEIKQYIEELKQSNENQKYLQEINIIYNRTKCNNKKLLSKAATIDLYEIVGKNIKEDITIFDQKRKDGENENLICQIIRKDEIEEFITYVNKENYSLNSYIERSIFETNSFLLEHSKTALIEYSAFFGSIQIFTYLYKNGVEFTESLWLYAIHGENEEIFHILEQIKIPKENIFYQNCFSESIKCHHNDVANYIQQNYINEQMDANFIASNCFHFYNFLFYPNEIQNDYLLFYACKYDYYTIVEYLLNKEKIDVYSMVV